MEDLSLHILDIAENSIRAGARTIEIVICEDLRHDRLQVVIADDGGGIAPAAAARVTDPFYTTRTERRIGLGLPLLEQAAREANGNLEVRSVPGQGTRVSATFQLSHIDRRPIGRMPDTITALIAARPDIELSYRHDRDGGSVSFDTRDLRQGEHRPALNTGDMLNLINQYLTREEHRLDRLCAKEDQ